MTLRAISVQPAWAWFIVNGYKPIENRSWSTNYRGRLLIHATGGTRDKRRIAAMLEESDQVRLWVQRNVGVEVASKIPMHVPYGGIVGAVTLTGILPRLAKPTNAWHMPGHLGLVLADPEPLPLYPCKGALNLWGRFELEGGRVRLAA